MSLYNNKYRVESTRLKNWDYSNTGLYYVTINTYKMKKYFGEIIRGKMQLNEAGVIADEEWKNNEVKRNNVILDEYVIMPNHIHGILAIEKLTESLKPETTQLHRQSSRVVSTEAKGTLKANSLGSILGQFKSKCTSRILDINPVFKWQGRFHDRIIRNEQELDNIRAYIHYNPMKWSEDEFYIE